MDKFDIWMPLSVVVFGVLFTRLKGRAQLVVLWVYLWIDAGFLFLKQWQFHQKWLALVSDAQGHGFGPDFLHQTTARHYQSLWQGITVAVVVMLVPVIWYWLDWRKEHISGQPQHAA